MSGMSVRVRFDSPLSSKIVVYGHCLVILPLTIIATLKWLTLLPILMQNHSVGDRYIITTTPTHPEIRRP